MNTWAILATGPSMSQAVVDAVRGRVSGMIAVSDAYLLAPDADALVSADSMWWKAHPDAFKFRGRKFCTSQFKGLEQVEVSYRYGVGCNSALQAMRVAEGVFKAERILLLGVDLHGEHFFGRHPAPLINASQKKLVFLNHQFRKWKGCKVINCTPGSKLTAFPIKPFEEAVAA